MIRFHVDGIPVQQGNHRRNAAGATYETSKNHRPWRDSVVWHAREVAKGQVDLFTGPVDLRLDFTYPRPKNHYRTGANSDLLRGTAPTWKTTAPDIDKLARSVLDALALAGIYRSDAQVGVLTTTKQYGDRPGVTVAIDELEDDG